MEQLTLTKYPYIKILKIQKDEIEKIDFSLCKQPTETLESYYNRQSIKPELIINGGFFNMSTGESSFTYVDEHKIISKNNSLLYGFGIQGSNTLIAGNYDSSKRDFISAYPVLLKKGQPFTSSIASEINYRARRTVLGYNDTHIFIILVDNPGLDFDQLKNLCVQLNILEAINLDGGGSTRCLKNGVRITELVASRPVDNLVAFYLKKQVSTQTVYRVQTGAFSKQLNAEKYRDTIRKIDDNIGAGYKNAYVRYINSLYKVQVGAFSKKENAEKVVKDLISKGYNSFITTL